MSVNVRNGGTLTCGILPVVGDAVQVHNRNSFYFSRKRKS